MKKYRVAIKAEVIKWVDVVADDEEQAQAKAEDMFSVNMDGCPETYEQTTINVEELK